MSSLKVFLVLALMSFAFSVPAFANEEKKAEGGEGKEEAKGEKEKKDEYAEAAGQVAALQAKVKASEEAIHKLIEEKQTAKEPDKVGEIVKSLVNEHKILQKNAEEYERARAYLQYRFPEKGMKEKRNYERVEVKSLEEMENQQSLESRIKKTLGRVRKQYDAPEPKKKAVTPAEKEKRANGKRENKKAPEGPSISDPVILTK